MEENRINEIEAYAKRREEESIQKELAEKNEKEILLAKISAHDAVEKFKK